MQLTRLSLFILALFALSASLALAAAPETPGCEGSTPQQCLGRALDAMGGRDRLAAIRTVRLDVISHTELTEQSYRQAPFITSYSRDKITVDHADQRLLDQSHAVWPESDLKQADSDSTLIVTRQGGVNRSDSQDWPCSAAQLDSARQSFALAPETVLLTAASASDLRYLSPETVRSTQHTVLAFTWSSIPVRVLINRFTHLPDAVETLQMFRDFWYYWGDVEQRVDFDNWRLVDGVEYPSNQIVERNGIFWSSSQALDIAFNAPLDAKAEKDFVVDDKVARASTQSKGWADATFHADRDTTLEPGIDLFTGSWNTTIVKLPNSVVILDTPISSGFTQGIVAEAQKRYPGAPIAAVLSTSDSWPHVGGIRFDVAQGLPTYILDLNEALLDRMLRAPHAIDPDPLERTPKAAKWKVISARTEIGTGPNRMVLFPIRGASTERQYMVYFPEQRLLYASDTLVLNPDKTLYDPELVHEVAQAVAREHLAVDTVYAMHQAPVSWSDVLTLLHTAGSLTTNPSS